MLSFEVHSPRVVDQKYVLVELIGLGSMGEVWVAHHAALEQPCAVKLLSLDEHEATDVALLRFAREARIVASLSRKTRHIVSVTDYGADAQGPYLVMELLEGESFEQRIARGCTPEVVSAIVSQIAKGLSVAHREGVIHRDLKPANVFLTRTEEGELLVKVLDFGIARMMTPHVRPLTVNGVVVGSPAYMSPEQLYGEALDARADVWSLAVSAYEALTGTLPESGRPLSTELEAVFARAFAPNIADRFQTAQDFAHAFAAACAPVRAPPRWSKRSLARLAIAAGLFVYTTAPAPETHVATARTTAPLVAVAPTPPPVVNEAPVEEPSAIPAPPPVVRAQPARPKPVVDPSSIF